MIYILIQTYDTVLSPTIYKFMESKKSICGHNISKGQTPVDYWWFTLTIVNVS